MFGKFLGHKQQLVEQLSQEGGVVAWATITDVADEWASARVDGFNQVESRTDHLNLTLSVQPDGGEPFQATISQAFSTFRPFKDWQCKVIYDPNDRSRIAVMEDTVTPPGMDHARAENAAQIRSEAMAAAASGNIADFVQSMQARAMSGQLGGGVAMDPRLIQQAMAAAGANLAAMNGVPGAGSASSTGTPSVADELAKLADLRDRGVLSEAEFEVQKAKLLAQD